MGDIIRKSKIGLFVDTDITGVTPAFKRIKKSTTITLSANPSTVEYDYIADENPSTELISYNYSIDQDLVMIKGEPDYDFAFHKLYNMHVGADAHVDTIIAFLQEYTIANTATPTVSGTGVTAAEVVAGTFATKVINLPGTYVFTYDGTNWKLDGETALIADYGITITGTPVDEDEISIVFTATYHYKAWKVDSIFSTSDLAGNDSKINFNLKFSGNIAKGTITLTNGVPTFTVS